MVHLGPLALAFMPSGWCMNLAMPPETVSAVKSDSLRKAMLQPYHWQAGQTCSLHPP